MGNGRAPGVRYMDASIDLGTNDNLEVKREGYEPVRFRTEEGKLSIYLDGQWIALQPQDGSVAQLVRAVDS